MSKPASTNVSHFPPAPEPSPVPRRFKSLGFLLAGLVLSFSLPLLELIRFCLHSQLYSYILLVPFVSLYLVWSKRKNISAEFRSAKPYGVGLALAGLALVVVSSIATSAASKAAAQNYLFQVTLSFVLLVWSASMFLAGARTCRDLAFPMAFLVFMVPLPATLEGWVEAFLQHASAEVAYIMLKVAGTPVFREATTFMMPNISIDVAPECSGIHSTVVLFVTGLLAGHFFLRRTWSKVVLAVGVVVLGVMRNAVRVFTLAELCVHVNPQIIDSPLHHRGGPIFFAISLIPFFLLLWFLRKRDSRWSPPSPR